MSRKAGTRSFARSHALNTLHDKPFDQGLTTYYSNTEACAGIFAATPFRLRDRGQNRLVWRGAIRPCYEQAYP